MEDQTKEVYFYMYCQRCVHLSKRDTEGEEPCNECLANPYNYESHKPLKFEQNGYIHGTTK